MANFKTGSDVIKAVQKWLTAEKAVLLNGAAKTWCTLDMTESITSASLTEFFDRKDLNKEYVTNYNESNIKNKKAFPHLQLSINTIYGAHKSFDVRHKTRLQYYRDNLSNKAVRIPQTLNKASGAMDNYNTTLSGGTKASN